MLRSSGFTLIELIGVIVVVSVGMVGVARLFGNTNSALSRATTEQVLSQLVQECAERVLETRRDFGFSYPNISPNINSPICDPPLSSYTRSVSITDVTNATTSPTPACPDAVVCHNVTVTVTDQTTAATASATLMLVPY